MNLEMCLIIDEKYPYQLIDTLKLEELMSEHRVLNLIIKENPDFMIPSRLKSKRNISYLTGEERPYFEVINFRNIYDTDIKYISSWLDKLNRKLFIEIDCLHSRFEQIMNIIIDTLEFSVMYGYEPIIIRGIVFYNYDKDVHHVHEVVEKFNRIIKEEENKCFNILQKIFCRIVLIISIILFIISIHTRIYIIKFF